jgi:hypothetical protein
MRIRSCALAALVPLVSILIALVAASGLAPSRANATPAFARQTGLSCQACHTVFPELTPFGRKFKLNAYVFTNTKQLQDINPQRERTLSLSDIPPLSVMLQASNTTLARGVPDSSVAAGNNVLTPGDLSQKNDTQFPQSLSLLYTGKISDNLGAFLQLTWAPDADSVGIDNSDLRFANHAEFESVGVTDFIYGITLNNNPTSQDVWNSTPAWGFPFIATNVGVPPAAQTLLDGQLAQQAAGLGAYVYLFNHLYLEFSAYRSAQTSFTNATTGGPGPLDSTAPNQRIAGNAAPYWRAAWEQDWGNHALSFGTYGIYAPTHPVCNSSTVPPTCVGESGPANTFTDVGVDAQYQYITDNHTVSVTANWIHEWRKFNSSNINNLLLAANTRDTLDTVRLTGTYFFKRMIGGTVQLFSTTGTPDTLAYGSGIQTVGSANGSPTTQGAMFELDYLPWLNTKLGIQYTLYTEFNGKSRNYDGFGRNASENNTLYVFVWTAF